MDNISQEQTIQSASGAPVTPAAQPPKPQTEQTPADDPKATIMRLEAELKAMRAEREESDKLRSEMEVLRLSNAKAEATKPAVKIGIGAQEIARERAIRSVGGLAAWNSLAPERRTELLGVAGGTTITDAELKKYFGRNSDAVLASRLARQDPKRYAAMRVVARERNIF